MNIDYLKPYDFSMVLTLDTQQRMHTALEQLQRNETHNDYAQFRMLPLCLPARASDQDVQALERQLEIPLPSDYRVFIQTWGYLDITSGLSVFGLDQEGLSVGGPWVLDKRPFPSTYLVIGDYWRFADGDQFLLDLDDPSHPVLVYLHEHEYGPRLEPFAPSFSCALWRLAFEDW